LFDDLVGAAEEHLLDVWFCFLQVQIIWSTP